MAKVKSDIEIAREAKMKPIQEVLNGLNVPDKAEVYSPIGRYIAKIKTEYLDTLTNKAINILGIVNWTSVNLITMISYFPPR